MVCMVGANQPTGEIDKIPDGLQGKFNDWPDEIFPASIKDYFSDASSA